MRPHELAAQIRATEPSPPDPLPEYADIVWLINSSNPVREQLEAGRFEENEHGHLSVKAREWAEWPGNRPDGLDLFFVDPDGTETKLGEVIVSGRGGGIAYVVTDKTGLPERIGPDDERWDVIVGSLTRAIDSCKQPADPEPTGPDPAAYSGD